MKVKLRDVSNIIMGQSPDSSTYNTEKIGLPFFQGNADFGELNPIAKTWCSAPIKIAYKNYILISVRAPIGALNIAAETCCIGRGLAAFDVNNKMCTQKYLWYLLKAKKNELLSKGTGSTFKAISKNILSEMEFNIPPVREQELCTKVLDVVFCLIRLKKEQLDKLDLLVKSRFIEMFGDPVTNEKGWVKVRLADKCCIITGNTPPRANEKYYGSYIEWIKSDNITSSMYLTKAAEYLSEEGLAVGKKVESGSVLMTCIAGSLKSIGNVAIADRPVTFNQQINAVVTNEQNTLFMYEQFKLTKEYITCDVNMALKGILSKGQLSEKQFIFPPIELQNQFADFVVQVDKSKFVVTAKFQ